MATGTTSDFVITRNDLIAAALRKVKGWPEDGNPPVHKIREAIRALNLLLRTEDLKQTGLAKSLWALSSIAVPMVEDRYIYGEDEGLSATILELHAVMYRDTTGGEVSIEYITSEMYARKSPKSETGDPECVYLEKARLLSNQKLYVWPVPTTITAGDTVIQDEVRYLCTLKHTSSTETKPNSGSSWQLFWQVDDVSAGSANTWVTATEYTNGPLVILHFKRPLFDFTSAYDNPDFPQGWEDYLIYKLANRLAPDYDLGADARQLLRTDLAQIEADIMPSATPKTNRPNRVVYF